MNGAVFTEADRTPQLNERPEALFLIGRSPGDNGLFGRNRPECWNRGHVLVAMFST